MFLQSSHRLLLLLAVLLSTLLFLGLDQAGRREFVSEFGTPTPLGTEAKCRMAPPSGKYDFFVRVMADGRIESIELVADDFHLRRKNTRCLGTRTKVDVYMGSVQLDGRGFDLLIRSALGRGSIEAVVAEPSLALAGGVTRDSLQRMMAAAAVVSLCFFFAPLTRWRLGLLLLLLAGLFVLRQICFDLVPYAVGDIRAAFYPWHQFAAREFAAGRIPLWNPHVFAGHPFLANMQSQTLYPPVLILHLLRSSFRMRETVLELLHFALAATGAASLARKIGVSRGGAFVAGVLYMFAPSMLNQQQAPMVYVTSFLPWLLWAILDPKALLLLAGLLALGFLAGHLQLFLYALVALIVVRVWPPMPRHRTLPTAGLIGALGLAALWSAALGLPFVEFAAASNRSAGLGPKHNSLGSLSPRWVIETLGAEWNLRPVAKIPSRRASSVALLSAAGLSLFAAGVANVFRRRRRRASASFLVLTLVGVVLALGDIGSLSPHVLLSRLPGFASSRGPARALVIANVGISLLAALGFDRLRLGARRPRVLVLPTVLGTLGVFGAVGLAHVTWKTSSPSLGEVAGLLAAVCLAPVVIGVAGRRSGRVILGVVLAGTAAERFDDAWGTRSGAWPALYAVHPRASRPQDPALREVELDVMVANDTMITGRLGAWGYDAVIARRTSLLWKYLGEGVFRFDKQGRLESSRAAISWSNLTNTRGIELMQIMGVDKVWPPGSRGQLPGKPSTDLTPSGLRPGELRYEGSRRARLLGEVRFASDLDEAAEVLFSTKLWPPIVEDPDGERLLHAQKEPASKAEVRDLAPGEVTVRIEPPRDGYLMLSDTFYPGWECTVDGRPP